MVFNTQRKKRNSYEEHEYNARRTSDVDDTEVNESENEEWDDGYDIMNQQQKVRRLTNFCWFSFETRSGRCIGLFMTKNGY